MMDEQNTQPQEPATVPPYQNPAAVYEDTSTLSIGNYIVMMIISAIPIVNIIMLFVWGFGHSNRNKKNYARAQLIMLAIGIVLSIIFYSSIIAAFTSMGNRF